jgi:hypothetical protein
MIDLSILWSISYEGRVMYLSTLRNSKLWLKKKRESALKFSSLIKVDNIHQEHLKIIVKAMGSNNNLQYHIHLSKMELLRGRTKHWWNVLAVCFKVKKNVMVFGQSH